MEMLKELTTECWGAAPAHLSCSLMPTFVPRLALSTNINNAQPELHNQGDDSTVCLFLEAVEMNSRVNDGRSLCVRRSWPAH